ncbi:amidohydrolase [Clostridium sp. OF09-10]|nr:DUF6282 family protein [Clostridium sp. OF09-10]RHV97751.1 amidohydrolase [Clostridium sp. OF09-10]
MEDILKGAYDMHIHTSPDVSPRKSTDLEIAEEWKTAGMKGGVVKCHFADTTGRAAILSALYPDLKIYGGLVLNRQAGGKYVWFPTMDSLAYRKFHFRNDPSADLSPYLSVLGEDGKLLPAVYDVLDIAAKYDLVVGTGHIGGQEGVPVVLEAAKRGVKRLVLTHAENPATSFSVEDQKLCVKAGAMVEHSFFTVYHNRVSWELVIEQIRAVGTDNTYLVTDFGQLNSPGSADGLRMFAEGLLERGFSEEEIDKLIRRNPERLFL